jgi:hypothetical protein
MNKKLFLSGMLALVLTFGMAFTGCDAESSGGSSCDKENNCSGSNEYCGRSGCDAEYYGDDCDCR